MLRYDNHDFIVYNCLKNIHFQNRFTGVKCRGQHNYGNEDCKSHASFLHRAMPIYNNDHAIGFVSVGRDPLGRTKLISCLA